MIGTIYMYAGSVAPSNFLICDGSAVSRSTYSALFDMIGTTFGTGDGSTTFNIPNLSGRVAIGVSSQHSLGTSGGEETCTLTTTTIPSHTHQIPQHGHTNNISIKTPEFTHSITQPTVAYNPPSSTVTDGAYTGATGYGSVTSTAATRSRNVSIGNHAADSCTGSLTVANSTAYDSNNTGSGTAHNNMQPYVTMVYIIQVAE